MAAPWKAPKKAEYDQPPAGNHPAVMVAMVDLGTQVQDFKGEVKRSRRAMCVWELVTERDTNYPAEERNFVVGIDLTLSNHEKSKFRQWAEARTGKKMPADYEHDFSQELGKPCLLNVTHNAAGYPKVNGMSAVPKGMTVPKAKLGPFLWSLDDLPTDDGEPDLPDWMPRLYGKRLADVIAECVELNGENDAKVPAKAAAHPDDGDADADIDPSDIPF